MSHNPIPRWLSRLFLFCMIAMAVTGMLQMPLAGRYYIASAPGLAWTGDFFFVHKLHYILAALTLFVVSLISMNWFMSWRKKLQLTSMGTARVVVLAGIFLSGFGRVYRNLPDVNVHPIAVLVIEWTHFGLVMVLGGLALTALLKRASRYAVPR